MNHQHELPQDGFVTPHWVKRRYSISNSTLYEWVASKHLPPLYKIGKRASRFRVVDIQHFEENLLRHNEQGR